MFFPLLLAVGDYVQALECTRTYLLFHPDDEDVLENEDYYKSLLEGSLDLEAVKPREVSGSDVGARLGCNFEDPWPW